MRYLTYFLFAGVLAIVAVNHGVVNFLEFQSSAVKGLIRKSDLNENRMAAEKKFETTPKMEELDSSLKDLRERQARMRDVSKFDRMRVKDELTRQRHQQRDTLNALSMQRDNSQRLRAEQSIKARQAQADYRNLMRDLKLRNL